MVNGSSFIILAPPPPIQLLCLSALAVSRFCNIYPCGLVVNYLRTTERRLSQRQLFMMWWSGLRGAMAFTLSIQAAQAYGEQGEVGRRGWGGGLGADLAPPHQVIGQVRDFALVW